MVKKIFSIMVFIIIICSSCVYGFDIIFSDNTNTSSQEQGFQEVKDNENSNTNTDNNNSNTGSQPNEGENSASNDIINKDENTISSEENNNDNKKDDTKVETSQNTTTDSKETQKNNNVTKSSEARLKELKVNIEGLTPDFDRNTTEYYLIVDLSINKIKITASTIDNKAKWATYGNANLKEGENKITILVTAEDGTEKEYYIYVTKIDNVELANAELENLEIEGYSLYPSFKSNIYSYNLNINQNITSLNITSTPQREKATVVIEGNTNLQKGENVIKIIVTAEDNTTIRTYKINAYIDSKRVEIEEEDKMPAIILIAGLSVCIVVLGVYIIVKKRR